MNLTLYHTISCFDNHVKEAFCKYCGKRMLINLLMTDPVISVKVNLS